MRFILGLIYFLASTSCILDNKSKEKLDKRILEISNTNKKREITDYIDKVITFISDQKGYEINEYRGAGGYGFVFKGLKFRKTYWFGDPMVGHELALKIMYRGQTSTCRKDPVLKDLKNKSDSPVVRLEEEFEVDFTEKSPDLRIYFCIVVMEVAHQSLEKSFLLADNDEQTKKQNTLILGYVIYKLIKAFKIFNFTYEYLHADVKPANLVVVKSQIKDLLESGINDSSPRSLTLTCLLSPIAKWTRMDVGSVKN